MKTKGKALAITGAVLQIGPLFGLLGTIIGMVSAFQTMGQEGTGNAEALAHDIGFALITTVIGLGVGTIGLILIFIALLGPKYRAPWLFWFLVVISIFWIPRFPLGTVIGVCLLVYVITHRMEFKDVGLIAEGVVRTQDRLPSTTKTADQEG